MARLACAVLGLVAGCGGADERLPPVVVDARGLDAPTLDAAIDAPPGLACVAGADAAVTVELGGGAAPLAFVAAWFNRGHVTKACFAIDVALSTRAHVEDPYLTDPALLEVTFPQPPVLGVNTVQLHLHQPDTFLGGTTTVTALADGEVTGSLAATSGAITVAGTFTAVRCAGIFDPCL